MLLLLACPLLTGCDAGETDPSGSAPVTDAVGVVAGTVGSCALRSTGAVDCWGATPPGIVTDTTRFWYAISLGARPAVLPEPLTTLSLSDNPFAPSGCGVGRSGAVYCWGQLWIHFDWTLPLGETITPLAGVTGASSVSVGIGDLCVTRTDHLLDCVGEYNGGARGTDSVDLATLDPDATLIPNGVGPGFTAFSSAIGRRFGCALHTDSLVACWGETGAGQVGRLVPDTLQDCGAFSNGWCQPVPAPVDGVRRYLQLSASEATACATSVYGEVYCWGWRPGGTSCAIAGDCVRTPTKVSLPGPATEVAVGASHICALLLSGAAYCWGDNASGQLGRPGGGSAGPVPVTGGHLFTTLDAGANHTCGVEQGSGTIQCWGQNAEGQLGDRTLIDRDHPVAVVEAH